MIEIGNKECQDFVEGSTEGAICWFLRSTVASVGILCQVVLEAQDRVLQGPYQGLLRTSPLGCSYVATAGSNEVW